MELRDCESIEKLPSKIYTLRFLFIMGCSKITGPIIPQDGPTPSGNNPMYQLEYLWIHKCNSPISFPFANGRFAALKELVIRECEGVESLEEITVESLEYLYISTCKNLRSLPPWSLDTLSYLTRLRIYDCPALEVEEFPLLPITLSSLGLSKCPKIKSIAAIPNNLTELEIRDCPTLEMEEFPPLPITLSSLYLGYCPKIKSIIATIPNNLTELRIEECPELKIEKEFPPLPITLSYIYVWNCRKIRCLPNQWHHLPSLHEIDIRECPGIECFPQGGFPPYLRSLIFRGCENVKQPVRDWGLTFLTSLQELSIDGRSMGGGEGEKVCFPSEDDEDAWSLLFPSSLTFLRMYNMRKVERLSNGLRNHFSSLVEFWIHDCPKLRDLPEDGLPLSLLRLWIEGCLILKDRCSTLTGHHWPLIQHIPYIEIDGKRIQ